jgi:hypothetical protein
MAENVQRNDSLPPHATSATKDAMDILLLRSDHYVKCQEGNTTRI